VQGPPPASPGAPVSATAGVAPDAVPDAPDAADLPLATDIPRLAALCSAWDPAHVTFLSKVQTGVPRFQRQKSVLEVNDSAIASVSTYYYITVACAGAYMLRCNLHMTTDTRMTMLPALTGDGMRRRVETGNHSARASSQEYQEDDDEIDIIRGIRVNKKKSKYPATSADSEQMAKLKQHEKMSQRTENMAILAEQERLSEIVAKNAPHLYAKLEQLRNDRSSSDELIMRMKKQYGKMFNII
jgi:hypothetical protein